jgi:hypothetical protein
MTIQDINRTMNHKKVLLQHSLYAKVKTIEDLQSFLECICGMGLYVFTKSVAIKINVYDILGFNCKSETRYLINEIVVESLI